MYTEQQLLTTSGSSVNLPIKPLPIVERWDCTSCDRCCRGSLIFLDSADLQRLQQQGWDRHPDFAGTATIVRHGWFGSRHRLAHRPDGSCVFLTADGLCRIHQDFGWEAKPLVCRMYPLQLVPLEKVALLTLRRSCPAAAADRGRPVAEYRSQARRAAGERPALAEPSSPPPILARQQRSWSDTSLVTEALARLLGDERFPLVRRVVHGLAFCDLLAGCRLRQLDSGRLQELVGVLEQNAPGEAAEWFRDRRPVGRAAATLFRQTVADYLRLHPRFSAQSGWAARWRMVQAAWGFARGRGQVPQLDPGFPTARFEELDQREFGHLPPDVQQPLIRYFQVSAASQQYAVASRPGWPLVEQYRALALGLPVALWMLRYFCHDRLPTAADVVDVIAALDRGQGFEPLAGSQHRRRVAQLAGLNQLAPLCVWYAR